jgi:hypothetical protein
LMIKQLLIPSNVMNDRVSNQHEQP